MNLTPNPERVPGRMLTFDRNPRTDARHTTARTGPTGAAHGLASSPRFPTPPPPKRPHARLVVRLASCTRGRLLACAPVRVHAASMETKRWECKQEWRRRSLLWMRR